MAQLAEVKFKTGTSVEYTALSQKDSHTFYFITDNNKVYLGSIQLTNGDATQVMQGSSAQINIDPATSGLRKSEPGMIYIYTDYSQSQYGVKIGDGNAAVIDLPFIQDLANHIQDSVVHITATERTFWNSKVDIDQYKSYDNPLQGTYLENQILVFTRGAVTPAPNN